MDLDSDYCSNDSDAHIQNSSRTPTPPKLENGNLKQEDVIKNSASGITFLMVESGEKLTVLDTHSIRGKSQILDNQIISSYREHNEVKISDCDDPIAFKVFLEKLSTLWTCFLSKYLETDGFKPEEPGIAPYSANLIRLCLSYEVPHLLNRFVPLAKQNLTLANCVDLYTIGAMRDIEDLRVAAYNFILRSGNAFVEHPNFLKLDCITLSILISSDDFQVVEITLFKRLKDWVTEQCLRLGYPPDRKEFFGRVAGLHFQHVRYSQMTPKEFCNDVVPSGLLSKKDIEAINLRHRTHQLYWQMLAPYNFSDRPRAATKLQFAVPIYNNVQIGFRKIHGTSSTIQESVRFMVSNDIYLTAIGFFGPAKGDRCPSGTTPLTAYSIKIHVEGDYSKYYSRLPIQNATVITRDNFAVELSHPLHIQKLQPYKLTVWIDGEVTQFGVFPLPQAIVLVHNNEIPMITFHFSDADSDPIPTLEAPPGPSSTTPIFNQYAPNNFATSSSARVQYKQEPRMSGVIRCISFVMKD